MAALVTAVSCSGGHTFSKSNVPIITLVAGLGVKGDAHYGHKVQHLFHARREPDAPNLRQVHLIHEELFDELRTDGFEVRPGDIGENVTTRGLDLLAFPAGALLQLGNEAVIQLTGLRNPCRQIDNFAKGLTAAVLDRNSVGQLIRKAGVMAIVIKSGDVRAGDAIAVELPAGVHRPLLPV
jgi:MOSC domain-containing protein YiiM